MKVQHLKGALKTKGKQKTNGGNMNRDYIITTSNIIIPLSEKNKTLWLLELSGTKGIWSKLRIRVSQNKKNGRS